MFWLVLALRHGGVVPSTPVLSGGSTPHGEGEFVSGRVRGFGPILSQPAQIFTHFGSHVHVFSPLNRLEMRQTKARNGFSALQIGGYNVANP